MKPRCAQGTALLRVGERVAARSDQGTAGREWSTGARGQKTIRRGYFRANHPVGLSSADRSAAVTASSVRLASLPLSSDPAEVLCCPSSVFHVPSRCVPSGSARRRLRAFPARRGRTAMVDTHPWWTLRTVYATDGGRHASAGDDGGAAAGWFADPPPCRRTPSGRCRKRIVGLSCRSNSRPGPELIPGRHA